MSPDIIPTLALPERFAVTMMALGAWEHAPHIAVAVSGGADSMALCLLAHRWVTARGGSVTAFTVDHQLRPEAASEARQVAAWLTKHSISHAPLSWEGAKPVSGIQAGAREARYRLLEVACSRQHILHLLTGHHADDQAETFWQRLSHGSGPSGLAGMAAVVEKPSLRLMRPLLKETKSTLRAWLTEQGQEWLEDPSNHSAAYQRVRVRHWRQGLEEEGLSPERLQNVMAKHAEQRQAMEQLITASMVGCCRLTPEGEGAMLWDSYAALSPLLQRLLLGKMLSVIGGDASPPREEKLDRLIARWRQEGPSPATLHGCLLRYDAKARSLRLQAEKERNPLANHASLPHIREGSVWCPSRPLTDAGFIALG